MEMVQGSEVVQGLNYGHTRSRLMRSSQHRQNRLPGLLAQFVYVRGSPRADPVERWCVRAEE